MAESFAVAQSPLASDDQSAHRQGWVVDTVPVGSQLVLEDASPLTKVLIQRCSWDEPSREAPAGDHSSDILSMLPDLVVGEVRRQGDGWLACCTAPDEWMLLGPADAEALPATTTPNLLHIDFTHARAAMRLRGPGTFLVLEKICPIDLSRSGRAALRTSIAGVVTDIVILDLEKVPAVLLHCGRSYGRALHDAIADAGREHGLASGGVRWQA